jgi:uncharacterized protein YjdB
VRAIRPGRVQVVAISGEGSDSTLIVVRRRAVGAPAVASMSIAPVSPLRVGESATLQALGVKDSALTWNSSDSSVVTVDAGTGQVRAQAPGTAVIVAQGAADSASLELTVLPAAVAEVIIQGARPLVVGEKLSLHGIPTDAEGRALRDRLIAWMSSDTTILEVDAMTGEISARSPGAVDVTAMSEDGAGRARVTVFARDQPFE